MVLNEKRIVFFLVAALVPMQWACVSGSLEDSNIDLRRSEIVASAPEVASTVKQAAATSVDVSGGDACQSCQDPGQGTRDGCYGVDYLHGCSLEAVPRGIYVLVGWGADQVVDEKALSQPFVHGITVRQYWKDIETQPGVYNWDKIDRNFDLAMEQGKGVRLAITGGAYTPKWLIGDGRTSQGNAIQPEPACGEPGPHGPSAFGVERFCATVPNGEYNGQVRAFPAPWDATMLTRWYAFLDALVEHLKGQDGVDKTVRLPALDWIAVTGPNGHNGEVSHPEQYSPNKHPDGVDWLSLGLSNPLVPGGVVTTEEELLAALLEAWRPTLTKFDTLFGGAGVHYTVSLVYHSFPIGKGNLDNDLRFKNQLLADARSGLNSGYFGIQSNGLDDRASWAVTKSQEWPMGKDHWRFIRAHDVGPTTLTGLQSRAKVRLYDKDKSGSVEEDEIDPCTRGEVWKEMVSNAQCLQVDFVEAYAHDLNVDWEDRCEGGIRAQLLELSQWLTR
jgi:hypothetical protein